MNKRMYIWLMVGGLVLVALLLLASSAVASDPAASHNVYPDAALQDTTSWSSGWVDIAPGGTITFTHHLSGDPALYAVDLWFRDTRSPGFGIHRRAYGGMDAAGQRHGVHWQNLTDKSISVVRQADDVAAGQVRLRIWIPDPPDYDSDWVDIQSGQVITLTHNLGGSVNEYTVGIKLRDTSPGGLGVHQYAIGGLEAGGVFHGVAWQNLTDTTIRVWRFGGDPSAHQVRVSITRPDSPDYDSGWVDVSRGETRPFTHDLGGNPNGYVVRTSTRAVTPGGPGINARAAGGLEVGGQFYGANWENLTGTSINVLRRPHDVFADQVRLRIWVQELPVEPSYLSATLGVGQQADTTLTINNTGTESLDFEIREQVPITATEFLVLDHSMDKTFFAGHSYDTVSETEFATLSAEEMGPYRVVYLEPNWSNYGNLNQDVLAAYVQAGGVAVINIASYLPMTLTLLAPTSTEHGPTTPRPSCCLIIPTSPVSPTVGVC
jgi:hypothetical protein